MKEKTFIIYYTEQIHRKKVVLAKNKEEAHGKWLRGEYDLVGSSFLRQNEKLEALYENK